MIDRQTSRQSRSRQAAFSLIELVIVVLIIGIFTATAAPRFNSSLCRMRVESACNRIKADLTWARQTAINKSAAQSVQFTVGAAEYSVSGVNDLDRSANPYTVALGSSTYRCTIVSAVLGSDAVVQFDRFGRPDSGGTITIRSGSANRTVTINATTGGATIP